MLTDKRPFDYTHRKEVLDTLMTIWTRYPTLRLGQLIANAAKSNDVFSIQDTLLVQKLWEFDNEHENKNTGT